MMLCFASIASWTRSLEQQHVLQPDAVVQAPGAVEPVGFGAHSNRSESTRTAETAARPSSHRLTLPRFVFHSAISAASCAFAFGESFDGSLSASSRLYAQYQGEKLIAIVALWGLASATQASTAARPAVSF